MSQHGFDISEIVARLVADVRRREGLTTEELAERAGVHETYIGLVERNARQPTLAAAANLAEALGMSLSDLVAEAEQDANGGFVPEVELVHAPPRRYAKADCIVESERLTETTWLSGHIVRKAIDAAYRKLDVIDEQMRDSGSPVLVELVGLEPFDQPALRRARQRRRQGLATACTCRTGRASIPTCSRSSTGSRR